MFITSIKLTKQKLIIAVILAGLLLCGVILLIASGGKDESQITSALPSVKNIKTEQDRVSFLTGCGWQIDTQNVQSQEVLIPQTFDDAFSNYNELQKLEGFDLSQYKNKRVMRYTYTVLNYPANEENVQATLLIYKERIIGGDICSTQQDGFMHGLTYPQK